jgi:hypothetical protein
MSDVLNRPVEGDFELRESKAEPQAVTIDRSGAWEIVEKGITATFPPGEEPPPSLVAECRKHDPFFVPLWAWKVYRSPAGTDEKIGHYIIGRYVPSSQDKDGSKEPVRLTGWPADFPFDPSRIFELLSWTIKWPKGTIGAKLGLPEPAKPFDSRVVDYVKAQEDLRRNCSISEILLMIDKWEELDRLELQKVVEDAEYQLKQDWREMKKCVEEGRLLPPVWEKRPFVHLADTGERKDL